VNAPAQRLDRPELAPIVDELARRFSEGLAPVRLTLTDLTPPTRRALADLLGMDRLPAREFRLQVDRLLSVLGLTTSDQLREIVEQLTGQLPDLRAERAAHNAARATLWSWLAEQVAGLDLGSIGGDAAALDRWVDAQRAAGARGGIDTYQRRLASALDVLRALPGDGISLASFASDRAGGPHALDHGRAVATIVLDALATVLAWERPSSAEAVRALWEAVGVVPDPLSSTVTALGVPGGNRTPLERWLESAASVGEPVVVSLANLRRWPVAPLPADARLYVVENPALLIEAAVGRWHGPPIICSSGRPSIATVTMLRQLTAAGATAFQHADFDAAGLSITQWLVQQAGTIPWKMTADDYLTALRQSRPQATIDVSIPASPWDPLLHDAIDRERRAIYEEQVRTDLLTAMT